MTVHTYNPTHRELKQEDHLEFKASLGIQYEFKASLYSRSVSPNDLKKKKKRQPENKQE